MLTEAAKAGSPADGKVAMYRAASRMRSWNLMTLSVALPLLRTTAEALT